MASPIVLVLLVLAATCGASNLSPRIVGGESTTIERYPWIVQVESLGTFSGIWSLSCAANILTSRWLVSAAHCFSGIFYDINNRRIRAGTTYQGSGGVISNAVRSINHPSYNVIFRDGDINVFEVATPLTWNPAIQPASIIVQDFQLPDNLPVVHAGWGRTTQGGVTSPDLQHVTIYTVNNNICRERYQQLNPINMVTDNMICAGILDEGGKDACQGDSGGPLYYDDILVGVVSWGQGCANATYPGLSTSVSSYTNWIIATID